MCYHVSQQRLKEKQDKVNAVRKEDLILSLEDTFDAYFEDPEVFNPAWHLNGFEHGYLYCIPQESPQSIEPMHWGFVEQQAQYDAFFDPRIEDVEDIEGYWRKKGGYSLNGQVERVFDYYVTAEAIRYRRCLIPVTGFFESKHVGKNKYPHFIYPEDGNFLALAGIYNEYDDGLFTCKILTAPANPMMAEIHNSKKRQPVMLDPKNWDRYIHDGLEDDVVKNILFTDTTQEIVAHTVTKDVTNSRVPSNRDDVLQKVEYDELNTLF